MIRLSPASLSACAFFGSADAFVVSVRSTGSAESIAIRRSMPTRSSGSPPVRRSFATPTLDRRHARAA